jgi:hypothetical protein
MKHRVSQKIEEADEITIDLALTLAMPLSVDGISKDSKVWTKLKNTIIDHQSRLKLQDYVVISQSFSNVDFEDEIFWKIIEKKFTQELNE